MPEGTRTYSVGGVIYDIPESKGAQFIKENPSAQEVFSFSDNGKIYDVPFSDLGNFISDNPKIKPLNPNNTDYYFKTIYNTAKETLDYADTVGKLQAKANPITPEEPEKKKPYSKSGWGSVDPLLGKIVEGSADLLNDAGQGLLSIAPSTFKSISEFGKATLNAIESISPYGDLNAQKTLKPADDYLSGWSEYFSRELDYRQNKMSDNPTANFIGGLIPSAVQMAAVVVAPELAVPYMTGMGLQASGSAMHTYEQYQKQNGLPVDEDVKHGIGLLSGIIETATEGLGTATRYTKGLLFNVSKNNIVETAIRNPDRIAKIYKEFLLKNPSQASKILQATKQFTKQGTEEGLEEVLATLGTATVDRIFYDDKAFDGIGKEMIMSFAGGFALGSIFSGTSSAMYRNSVKRSIDETGMAFFGIDSNDNVFQVLGESDNKVYGMDIYGQPVTISRSEVPLIIDMTKDEYLGFQNLSRQNGTLPPEEKEIDIRLRSEISTIQHSIDGEPSGTIVQAVDQDDNVYYVKSGDYKGTATADNPVTLYDPRTGQTFIAPPGLIVEYEDVPIKDWYNVRFQESVASKVNEQALQEAQNIQQQTTGKAIYNGQEVVIEEKTTPMGTIRTYKTPDGNTNILPDDAQVEFVSEQQQPVAQDGRVTFDEKVGNYTHKIAKNQDGTLDVLYEFKDEKTAQQTASKLNNQILNYEFSPTVIPGEEYVDENGISRKGKDTVTLKGVLKEQQVSADQPVSPATTQQQQEVDYDTMSPEELLSTLPGMIGEEETLSILQSVNESIKSEIATLSKKAEKESSINKRIGYLSEIKSLKDRQLKVADAINALSLQLSNKVSNIPLPSQKRIQDIQQKQQEIAQAQQIEAQAEQLPTTEAKQTTKTRRTYFIPKEAIQRSATEPLTIEEAVLQFFVKGGRIAKRDYIALTGFGANPKNPHGQTELKQARWLYSDTGTPVDELLVGNVSPVIDAAIERDGVNAVQNVVQDVLLSHATRQDMIERLRTIQNEYTGELTDQELSEELARLERMEQEEFEDYMSSIETLPTSQEIAELFNLTPEEYETYTRENGKDDSVNNEGDRVIEAGSDQAVEGSAGGEETVITPTKIKLWTNEWNKLKDENNPQNLDMFYNKVKVALNGIAQSYGEDVVKEFEDLKAEIEQYAENYKNDHNQSTNHPNEQESQMQQSPSGEAETVGTEKPAEDNQDSITREILSQQPELKPTEGQKEAGNYKKAHISVQGMDISIENPQGSIRSGTDEDGKAWETEMKSNYGYFTKTTGKDGDHIDTFVGDNPNSETVFVVDQVNPKTKEFDESKVMLGFDTIEEASKAYLDNYEPGWQGMGSITPVSVEKFKEWLYDGARQRKPFAEYIGTPNPETPVEFIGDLLNQKLEDFGEKIGGARKDQDIKRSARNTDSLPAWRRKYSFTTPGISEIGKDVNTNMPFLVQWFEKGIWGDVQKVITTIEDGYITRKPKVFTSAQEAEDYIPIFEVHRQKYRVTKHKDGFVIYKTASTGKVMEFDVFPTKEEAVAFMNSTPGATSLLNRKREDFSIPALEKVERTGKDWRKGKDISTEEFMETFGFRGGEFGNWVKQEERRVLLNTAYDSLMDLAEMLNIPPKAISLGGNLSIAFGARGSGGIHAGAAHYESDRAVINMTRLNGAGSLAHEWAHALDNYFGLQGKKKTYERDEKNKLKAGRVYKTEGGGVFTSGMRKELSDIFEKISEYTVKKEVTQQMSVEKKQEDYDKLRIRTQNEADGLIKKFENGTKRYVYNRKTKQREETTIKATPEQIQKVKDITDRIVSGNSTAPVWKPISGLLGDYAHISEDIRELDTLHKAVFGYTGLKRNGMGFYNLGYYASKLYPAQEQLNKAIAGESETLKVETDYLRVSKEFDQTRVEPYWQKKVELFARAFEEYINEKLAGQKSDYLQYEKAPVYKAIYDKHPYPDGEERAELNKMFDELFNTLKVDENNALFEPVEAYHGSPHNFDEFSLSKIGTGEGAQAFGYGLYFTNKKAIAEDYAKRLIPEESRENQTINNIAADELKSTNGNVQLAISQLEETLKESWSDKKRVKAAIDVLKTGKPLKVAPKNVYAVTIHDGKEPSEYDYLRWDKPISEPQIEKIKKQAVNENILNQETGKLTSAYQDKGINASKAVEFALGQNEYVVYKNGKDFYNALGDVLGSDKAASEFLLRAGIDGIEYPAIAGTGGRDGDAMNYVVFDDKAITIKEHIIFEPKYVQQEIDFAHGSTEKQKEAIEKTVKEIETADIRWGKTGLPKVLRTVIETFKEQGYVDVVGTEVNSPQDVADLFSIYRSPYIEKAFVIFTKGNTIVGSTATTLNRSDRTLFLVPDEIHELAKKYDADGVYFMHNHPSGNHQVSPQDVRTTLYIQRALEGTGISLKGHVVIDHEKFSFIPTHDNIASVKTDQDLDDATDTHIKEKIQSIPYTNNNRPLYKNREKLPALQQQRLAEIASALLTEHSSNGAVIWLTPNLTISAWDVFPVQLSEDELVDAISGGLHRNLGAFYIVTHDGSMRLRNKYPAGMLDTINTKTGLSEPVRSYGDKPLSYSDRITLWDNNVRYDGSFAGNIIDPIPSKEKGMARAEFRDIINKSQLPHHNEFSHIYGSDYWTIDGNHYRVSDHSKKNNEIYELGVNDFRSYIDLYNFLKDKIDLSDKTDVEKKFRKQAESMVTVNKEGYYVTPSGSMFGSMDSATNNMWRTRLKNKTATIDVEDNTVNDIFDRNKDIPQLQIKEEFIGDVLELDEPRSKYRRAMSSEKPKPVSGKLNVTGTDRFIRGMFDKELDIKRSMDRIKELGGSVPDKYNLYLQATTLPGKNEIEIRDYHEKHLSKLVKVVADIDKPIEDINRYLKAKSAIERHENEGIDAYSRVPNGIWDYDVVHDIVNNFEHEISPDKVKDLWDTVKENTDFVLWTAFTKHKISLDAYNGYSSRQYYVPLRGWKVEGDMKDYTDFYGFLDTDQSYQEATIAMQGRSSEADDNILAYIQAMAETAIISGNKNLYKRNLEFIHGINAGNTDISQVMMKRSDVYEVLQKVDDGTGKLVDTWVEVTAKPSPSEFNNGTARTRRGYDLHRRKTRSLPLDEYSVSYYDNGQKKIIHFDDPNVASAINGTNNVGGELLHKSLEIAIPLWQGKRFSPVKFNMQLMDIGRKLLTQYNPAFVLGWNPLKDLMGVLPDYWIRGGNPGLVLKNLPLAYKALSYHFYGINKNHPAYQLADKYYRSGGKITYAKLQAIDKLSKSIEKRIKQHRFNDKYPTVASVNSYFKLLKDAWDYIALVSEVSTRVAIFKSELDRGMSNEQAVLKSQEHSGNFLKKGKYSDLAKPLWVFFNASAQGTYFKYNLAKEHKNRFIGMFTAMTGLGFLSALLQSLYFDDDDRKKMNDFLKYGLMPIPNFMSKKKGDYFKIPIPFFWTFPYAMGATTYDLIEGNIKPGEFALYNTNAFINSVSPIPVEYNDRDDYNPFTAVGRSVAPYTVRPFVDIAYNQDYTGRRIYGDRSRYERAELTPQSELGLKDTFAPLVWLSKKANELGGGDAKISAAWKQNPETGMYEYKWFNDMLFNWNPAKIEYLSVYFTGGVGRELSKSNKFVQGAIDPEEEIKAYNIPIVHRWYGVIPQKDNMKEYYDIRRELNNTIEIYSAAKRNGITETIKEIESNSSVMKQIFEHKMHDKVMDNLTDFKEQSNDPTIDEQIKNEQKRYLEAIKTYRK